MEKDVFRDGTELSDFTFAEVNLFPRSRPRVPKLNQSPDYIVEHRRFHRSRLLLLRRRLLRLLRLKRAEISSVKLFAFGVVELARRRGRQEETTGSVRLISLVLFCVVIDCDTLPLLLRDECFFSPPNGPLPNF